WTKSGVPSPTWLDIGFLLADAGGLILLVSLVLGGFGVYRLRHGKGAGLLKAALVLAGLPLAADVVAARGMSGNPDYVREKSPHPRGPLSFELQPGALTGLLTGHDVRRAFRVADLRRRVVAGAVQIAVDRVSDELVPVGIDEHVVVQIRRAVDVVPDEALPEAGVAVHGHAAVDHVVLDRVPRDVERAAERAGSPLEVDPSVD